MSCRVDTLFSMTLLTGRLFSQSIGVDDVELLDAVFLARIHSSDSCS